MPEDLTTPMNATGLTPEILEEARKRVTMVPADDLNSEAAEEAAKEPETTPAKPAKPEAQDAEIDELESEDEPEAKQTDKAEEEEDQPKRGLWDRDRQQRDQEAANERKALKAELDAMKAQLAAATQAAEKKADKTEDKVDAAKADALAEVEKQALEAIDSIDESADSVKIGKTVKGALAKAFEAIKSYKADHGDNAVVKELKQKLQDVEKRLNEESAAKEENKRQEAERRALEAQDAHIESLDKQYGARYHNAAIKAAREMMEEDGYSESKRPSLAYSKRVLDLAYAKVADKPAAARPEPKGPKPDTGIGGLSPNTSYVKAGTLEDVKRQILANRKKK